MESKKMSKEEQRAFDEATKRQDEMIKNGTWDKKKYGEMPPRGKLEPAKEERKDCIICAKKGNCNDTNCKSHNKYEFENKYENKICIGLPHTGTFPWNTTMSLLGLRLPAGFKAVYHMVGSCLVYDARQKIVDFARENKCKYVVMIDSDMVVPNDFLQKTIGLLEKEEKVHAVTGTIFKRTPPFQPCFYSKVEYDIKTQKPKLESPIEFPRKGIMQLGGMGLACCTIKTELFDIIDEKKSASMNGYFYPLPNMGEDLTFSLIARKCGGVMVCDLSIDVGHISAMPIHADHYHSCYEEWKKKNDGTPIFGEGVVSNDTRNDAGSQRK